LNHAISARFADPDYASVDKHPVIVDKVIQHIKANIGFSNVFHLLNHHQGLPRTGAIPNLTRGLPPQRRIRDVNKVIAIASAKGGVGKSTIAGMTIWHTLF
jgi:Mrp family chromosome partitioning ATPase